MPTGNTTSSSLCMRPIRRSGDALEVALQVGWQLRDHPAQSTCAGIYLLCALGSLIFLPQHSMPCHSDKAALWGHLACSGHSWVEASALAALLCASGALWYLLCAPNRSSAGSPHLLHTQIHTLQAVQCISREQKVFAKNIYAEVIYGLAHINPVAAVTQRGTKEPLSGEAHSQFCSPQVTKKQFQWLFNQIRRPGYSI